METAGLPLLGQGGCHEVYLLPDGNVLKVPKLAWRIVCDYETVAEDLRLAREYFGEFLWPTEAVPDGDFGGYFLKQPLLPRFESVTREKLEGDSRLRAEFDRIVESNERLYAETGRSFDFFGLEGMVAALAADGGSDENAVLQIFRQAFGTLVAKLHLGKDDVPAEIPVSNVLVVEENGCERLVIADPTLPNERGDEIEAFVFGHACNFFNRLAMERQLGIRILGRGRG